MPTRSFSFAIPGAVSGAPNGGSSASSGDAPRTGSTSVAPRAVSVTGSGDGQIHGQ